MKSFTTAGAIASLALLAEACILPEELANGGEAVVKRQTGNTGLAIGTGNRFANGTVPRGLGTQPPGTNLETLLNVGEITAAVQALVDEYDLESFVAPVKTYEGAEIVGAKVGGQKNCSSSYHVYFNGAIHARERGSSDNIIYFISDLLYANKHNTGLQYGGRTYTNCDVRRALAAGIVFTPLVSQCRPRAIPSAEIHQFVSNRMTYRATLTVSLGTRAPTPAGERTATPRPPLLATLLPLALT